VTGGRCNFVRMIGIACSLSAMGNSLIKRRRPRNLAIWLDEPNSSTTRDMRIVSRTAISIVSPKTNCGYGHTSEHVGTMPTMGPRSHLEPRLLLARVRDTLTETAENGHLGDARTRGGRTLKQFSGLPQRASPSTLLKFLIAPKPQMSDTHPQVGGS
jgi:hypothetical protein